MTEERFGATVAVQIEENGRYRLHANGRRPGDLRFMDLADQRRDGGIAHIAPPQRPLSGSGGGLAAAFYDGGRGLRFQGSDRQAVDLDDGGRLRRSLDLNVNSRLLCRARRVQADI